MVCLMARPLLTPEQLFDARAIKSDDPEECWGWRGTIKPTGYTTVTVAGPKRRNWLGHRLGWWLANGKPDVLPTDLHHTCGNAGCVNPAHLEALTAEEHRRRHYSECKRGLHDLTDPANRGANGCRPCYNERQRRYKRSRA